MIRMKWEENFKKLIKINKTGPSSVTTYKGTGNNKEVLGQGDLALSVGTRSTKVSTKK